MKTIDRVKKRFVEEGLDMALIGNPSDGIPATVRAAKGLYTREAPRTALPRFMAGATGMDYHTRSLCILTERVSLNH